MGPLNRTAFNRATQAAVIFLLVVSPVCFGGSEPWAFKSFTAIIFSLSFLWALRALRRDGFSYVQTPVVYLLFLTALLGVIQVVPLPVSVVGLLSPGRRTLMDAAGLNGGFETLALNSWAASGHAAFLVAVVLLYLIVFNTTRARSDINRFRVTLIAAGSAFAAYLFMQRASGFHRSALPFINKNHFAGYMEAVMPMAAAYLVFWRSDAVSQTGLAGWARALLRGERAWKAVLLATGLAVMLAALPASNSRGGLVGGAFSLVVLAAIALRGNLRAVWVLGGAAVALAVFMGFVAQESFLTRIRLFSAVEEDFSAMTRLAVWRDTLRIAAGFPLFGVGLGGFESAYPYYKSFMKEVNVNQPESDYLYLLAETGITGVLLTAGFAVMWFRSVAPSLVGGRDRFTAGVVAGAVSAIAALMLHGIVDTSLHMPAILLTVAVVAASSSAAATSRYTKNSPGPDGARRSVSLRSRPWTRRAVIAIAVCMPVLAAWSVAGAVADFCYVSAAHDLRAIGMPGRDREAVLGEMRWKNRAASALQPGCSEYAFEEGRTYYLLAELARGKEQVGEPLAGLENSEALFDSAYAAFSRAAESNPYSSFPHLMKARTLEFGLGRQAEAEAEYLKADSLNPTSPVIKDSLAGYYRRMGEYKTAREFSGSLPYLDPKLNPVSVFPDRTGYSASVGDVVTWSAVPKHPVTDMEFKFMLWRQGEGWVAERGFSSDSTWTWDTTGIEPGKYNVVVWMQSAEHKVKGASYVSPKPFSLTPSD